MKKTIEETKSKEITLCDICGKEGSYKKNGVMHHFFEEMSWNDVVTLKFISKKYTWDVHENCLIENLRNTVKPTVRENQIGFPR